MSPPLTFISLHFCILLILTSLTSFPLLLTFPSFTIFDFLYFHYYYFHFFHIHHTYLSHSILLCCHMFHVSVAFIVIHSLFMIFFLFSLILSEFYFVCSCIILLLLSSFVSFYFSSLFVVGTALFFLSFYFPLSFNLFYLHWISFLWTLNYSLISHSCCYIFTELEHVSVTIFSNLATFLHKDVIVLLLSLYIPLSSCSSSVLYSLLLLSLSILELWFSFVFLRLFNLIFRSFLLWLSVFSIIIIFFTFKPYTGCFFFIF